MLTINKLLPQGQGLAPVLLKRAASVELDWDVRQKSRFDATDSSGRTLGVFLPRGTVVRGGDVLVAEDGSLIRVHAAPQAVLKVTCCSTHGSAFDLTRAAYHLGNRHVALQLAPDHLKLEPDHVLADMLRQMHLNVHEVTEPFDPEAGAYGQAGGGHGHAQGDHDGHDHRHAAHPTPVAAADAHVHGPGCSHDHGHEVDPQHSHAHAHPHAVVAAATAPSAATVVSPRKPLSIPIQAAPAPHVHGPGCGHDHGHDNH
jgi:urease accessory protein